MAAPARFSAVQAVHAIRTTITFDATASAIYEIGTIPSGSVLLGVHVDVTELYDGDAPSLTVGRTGSTSLLMAAGDIVEGTAAGYSKLLAESITADTTYNIYFTAGTYNQTTGAADVTITYYPMDN